MKIQSNNGLVAVITILICANAGGVTYPTLNKGGEMQESVCTPHKLQDLRAELMTKKIRKAVQVWKAIRIMLCDATASNKAYVTSMLSKKLKRSSKVLPKNLFENVSMARACRYATYLLTV